MSFVMKTVTSHIHGEGRIFGGAVAAAMLIAASGAHAAAPGWLKRAFTLHGQTHAQKTVARYRIDAGGAFILDETAPRPLLKFDDNPEVWVLTASRGPRGDMIYVSDLGRPLLRTTRMGGVTVFTQERPEGSAAAPVGAGAPIRLVSVGPTAPAATLEGPQAVVRDASGNLFVVTDSGVIFKITPGTVAPGVMTIYVGTNTPGFSPNGTPAASTLTFEPFGAALDASGNLYYSDANNCVVREIVGGVVKTVAGNGTCGFSGDTGAATSATLNNPLGIAFDGTGNLYIADSGNNVIRRVDANGTITTYAGNTTAGFSGDGGAATSAELNFPQAVALDTAGDLSLRTPTTT